jgi:hypothetical protein
METELKQKAQIFFDKNIPVHIITNSDKWLNGYITEISADFFIILDRFDGEQPIFFSEIRIFEKFEGDYFTLKRKKDE